MLSGGSLSADSVRYNLSEENEIFNRTHSQYFPQVHHQVPMRANPNRTSDNSSAANRRSQHIRSMSVDQSSTNRATRSQDPRKEEEKSEEVERTFLSGCRGHWGTPRPDIKAPINLPVSGVVNPTEYGKLPSDLILHPGHIPPGLKASQSRHVSSRSVLGKSVVKNIHDFVVFERQSSKRSHPFFRNSNGYDQNPIMQPNFISSIRATTSEDLLEEQLVLELQKQRPRYHNTKRLLHFSAESPASLAHFKRRSLNQSDTSCDEVNMWSYSSNTRGQLPSPQTHYPPEELMMPHEQSPSPYTYQQPHPHQMQTSPQIVRPMSNSPKSYRGLNPTEASAIAAYDALQYNGWSQAGTELSGSNRNCEVPSSFVFNQSEHYFYGAKKRLSGQHPPSPIANPQADSYFGQVQNERNAFRHYSSPQQSLDSSDTPYHSESSSGYQITRDVPDGVPAPVSHVRRKSQDWNETDLDGEKQRQAMKGKAV